MALKFPEGPRWRPPRTACWTSIYQSLGPKCAKSAWCVEHWPSSEHAVNRRRGRDWWYDCFRYCQERKIEERSGHQEDLCEAGINYWRMSKRSVLNNIGNGHLINPDVLCDCPHAQTTASVQHFTHFLPMWVQETDWWTSGTLFVLDDIAALPGIFVQLKDLSSG